jgi:alcohol dehydrogenase (cytochrome c)
LYVAQHNDYSLFYLTDLDPRGSMGLGGKEEAQVGSGGSFLTAIDYTTGKVAWKRPYYGDGGGGGLLTTAGKLLFAGDGAGNLVAHDVPPASRFGIRASATFRIRRRRTCWTATSM